ncbi:hypothetical protein [Actinospica robiniae]|uniref:hypothetical protein n=1 Tax=Actinospica robiniae TaxID=304901 RepID=UPI000687D28B|nr:hypothetical protein [Actinospica robiniae]
MTSRGGCGASGVPAEHARFHGYIRALSQVGDGVVDADECDLIRTVLQDPDRAVAESAVMQHIDGMAERVESAEQYAGWRSSIAPVVEDRELLRRRLAEWALFKAIAGDSAWSTAELADASDWLQRKVAEHAHSRRALAALAEGGRTNRVRATARSRLNRLPG